MSSSGHVTILAVGDTGVGKSENGNAFLQKKLLEANSDPESCTFETSVQSNIVDGFTRYYIDTQGLGATDGLDSKHILQMVSFLKEWKLGINAFFVVINIQCPRFDQSIQKLLKIINDFFNNPNFWNQTGIIFTKCFQGNFNKEIGETKYRQTLINFIKTLPGCKNLNPQMLCFFVDSVKWETDKSTNFEYLRIFEFAHKNSPVPTNNLKAVNSEYKIIEPIIKKKVYINSKIDGVGPNAKKINYYEDQEITRFVDWENHESFSSPKTIKSYTEEIKTKVDEEIKKKVKVDSQIVGTGEDQKQIDYYEDRKIIRYFDMVNNKNVEKIEVLNSYTEEKTARVDEESKVDVKVDRVEKFKTVKVGKAHWYKHRKKEQVHDHWEITTKYITYNRKIIIDVLNEPHYGEWEVVDVKEEFTTEP